MTNNNDKGNSYILDSSDTEPYDLKKQPYSKQPCHTPDSDTPVTSVRPRIKLTRNPPTLDKSIWDKYDKEFENTIEKEWNSFKKGKIMPEQFVSNLNSTLASFLESKEDFKEESKYFFQHNKPNKEYLE